MSEPEPGTPLRIVIASAFLPGWQAVQRWAERRGHRVVLFLTPPRPRQIGYGRPPRFAVDAAIGDGEVLVTNRLRSTAADAVAGLRPDLLISAIFPRRLPPELITLPRLGAVNLHPGPLPESRGPTPQRLIFAGADTFGVTLHRVEAEFDTGPVLSAPRRPIPAEPTAGSLLAGWMAMFVEALDTGIDRVLAGEAGEPQPEEGVGYAGMFGLAERILSWADPASRLQQRVAALNMYTPLAQVAVDGHLHVVTEARTFSDDGVAREPGTVIERTDEDMLVQTADGLLWVRTVGEPFPDWRIL